MSPRAPRIGPARGEPLGRLPRTARRALYVLLACAACAPAPSAEAKAKPKQTGAVMTSEGVGVRKLGEVTPRMSHVGTSGRDFVDPSPLVLWGAAGPAAVLHFDVETRGRKAVQRIAPVDPGQRLPGFPVTYTVEVAPDATSEAGVEGLDAAALTPADLDGDGVQELVVVRRHGGVEVHSVRGPGAQYASPAGPVEGATYERYLVHVARLGGRDVVYVLSTCDAAGVADRNLLLRVDGAGVRRVQLAGLEHTRILALGALQRPASQDVDELLVLTADGAQDAALARYAPDGKPLAPARRLYVRAPEGAFLFVPRSASAVLEVTGGVLVLHPEKPANWIRKIELRREGDPRQIDVHFVADLDGDPKVIHGVGETLWAQDHDGTCFAPGPGKGWTPLPKPAPYLRLPVPAGEKLWFVWRSPAGPLLAVSSRARGPRPMTHDDWRRAADRWLPPAEAAELRKIVEPSLERAHIYRDTRMKRECEERGVDPSAVRSLDDWKRLLPESWADVQAYDVTTYDVKVAARFRRLGQEPKELARLPDPAGARAFLDELVVPARTTFLVVDGSSVSSASVPGAPLRELETQVRRPVEYQLREGRLTAVLALEKGDPAGEAPPAFHQVEAVLSRR